MPDNSNPDGIRSGMHSNCRTDLINADFFNSGITRSRQKSMQKVVEMTEKYLDEVQAKPGEYSFCIGFW